MTIQGMPKIEPEPSVETKERHGVGDLAAHQHGADMPAAICIMASVMMKDGMPIKVTPKALTQPEAESRRAAR